MTNQHPIQPSPELVEQCMEMFRSGTCMEAMCELAAQWGADQELEACAKWLIWRHSCHISDQLRYIRRPQPPSLREQALAVLDDCTDYISSAHENIIRQALEALPND